MVNSLLDDVNELLRLSYGDENRLEDIKRRLEDGLTIYNSDINYLKKLVENHKDEIQETAESESTTTEPEPLPVDDESEKLEDEKTQEKHSGGNLKKMGFGILATIAVISVFFAIGSLEEKGWIGSDEPITNTPNEILEERNKKYDELQKLEESSVDMMMNNIMPLMTGIQDWGPNSNRAGVTWTNNSENIYEGKIVYIECKVDFEKEQHQNYLSLLCTSNNQEELDDRLWSPIKYEALLKLTNTSYVWKSGDTFEGYVKVLPPTKHCKMYSNGQYWVDTREATHLKFNGDKCEDHWLAIHFEEVQMIYINSKNVFYGR